jgi:hypothetical protein
MDPRERKEILGEWGTRPENDRERVQREALERDLEGSPLRGQPLRRRLRNATPSIDGYVASLGGPLPYMVRLREIEAETAAHERGLRRAWHELAARSAGPEDFERRWRRLAGRWSFFAINELIDRHNRYYPVESRLPMDVRRRDFALVNGKPYRREPLDASWVLERFPPRLEAAAAA